MTALRDLSLHLADGEFVTVVGSNGAGKSSLLHSIAGVYAIEQGRIVIDGHDVTTWAEHRRARFIGRVFQYPAWTWPDDTGHIWEALSPHLSCIHKELKIKASVEETL